MGLFNSTCHSSVRLDGKVVVVTGGNTGIGKECSKEFYLRGAKVIIGSRSLEKSNEAIDDIINQCKHSSENSLGSLEAVHLDLASLESVRACAEEIKARVHKIDVLLNNAGVMMCPESRTKDGHELQFATNHLGHFLLTLSLMPKLIAGDSQPVRIVNVSSLAHVGGIMNFDDLNWTKREYSAIGAYSQSKLANVLFTRELAQRLQAAGLERIHTYCLHPGVIQTELGRHLSATYFPGVTFLIFKAFGLFMKSPKQGAQTSIHCCVCEKTSPDTGLYYNECSVEECSKNAKSVDDGRTLWEWSLKLVGLPSDYDPFK